MDPFIVNLSIRWLPAVGAFSASCVSQGWRHTLSADRDNGNLWQQICRNSGPSKIPSLENSSDYRRFAMGLRMRDNKPKAPPKPSCEPALCPQDFFAVVDLYRRHEGENGKRRKETLSSFTCPIHDSGFRLDIEPEEAGLILKGPNPHSASFDDPEDFLLWLETFSRPRGFDESVPHAHAPRKALGGRWHSWDVSSARALRLDCTLFRRDSAKSVCVLHDVLLNDLDFWKEETVAHTSDWFDVAFSANDDGKTARLVLHERSITEVKVHASISLAALLPAPGEGKEPKWLENSRQAVAEERIYQPDEKDLASLSKIHHFEIGLNRIKILFWACVCEPQGNGDFDDFESQNDLILVLEGLDWK